MEGIDKDTRGVYDLEKGLKALSSFEEEEEEEKDDEEEEKISIDFTAKRFLKVMSKRSRGRVKIDYLKLKMERAMGDVSMCSLLRELSRGQTQNSRILKSKDEELSRVRRDLKEARELVQEAVAAKNVSERSMMTKFVKLLNSKKAEIKRLKEEMKELRSVNFSSSNNHHSVSQSKQRRSQLYPTQFPPGESIETHDESSEDNAPTDDSEIEDAPQSPDRSGSSSIKDLERRKSGLEFLKKNGFSSSEDENEEEMERELLRKKALHKNQKKRPRTTTVTTTTTTSSNKRRRTTTKSKKKKSPRGETKLSDTKNASSSNNSSNVSWETLL